MVGCLQTVSWIIVILCAGVFAEVNKQKWSHQSRLGVEFKFGCISTFENITVDDGNDLKWTKQGENGEISTNEMYELQMNNRFLLLKKVTDDQSGVYYCNVYDNDIMVGRIVKGLNIGVRLYDDNMDKYRRNIIVGVISAASVFVLIVGTCALDHFKFETDENKEKRHMQKEERARKRLAVNETQEASGAFDNPAMDMSNDGRSEGYIVETNGRDVLNTQL